MEDYLAGLHAFEIEWVLWLQEFDWLALPMLAITMLGSQGFLLLLLPAVYWSIDRSIGYQLGFILLFSANLNSLFKLIFHLPRPYWVDTRVRAYLHEETFGMPSGHAQIAVAVLGLAGVIFRRRAVWIGVLLLSFLIGLSRVFLGVHFPSDVLVGWWIGAILLFVLLAILSTEQRAKRSPVVRYLLTGLLFLLAGWLTIELLVWTSWEVPEIWIENVGAAFPDLEPLNPLRLDEVVIASGAFFGFVAGGWWLATRSDYRVEGTLWQRILRYLIGMAGLAALYLLTSAVVPADPPFIAIALRFCQFALLGAWISLIAPSLFQRLGLAGRPEERK